MTKIGRPTLGIKALTKRLEVRLDPELLRRFRTVCTQEKVSVGEAVRIAVRFMVDNVSYLQFGKRK